MYFEILSVDIHDEHSVRSFHYWRHFSFLAMPRLHRPSCRCKEIIELVWEVVPEMRVLVPFKILLYEWIACFVRHRCHKILSASAKVFQRNAWITQMLQGLETNYRMELAEITVAHIATDILRTCVMPPRRLYRLFVNIYSAH